MTQAIHSDPLTQAFHQPRGIFRGFRWLRWVEHFFAILGILFLVFHIGFNITQMISPSMAPTLTGDGPVGGDLVFSERVSYWFRAPRRWEIVQFRKGEGLLVLKRIAALPGETVTIRNGAVVINGRSQCMPCSLENQKYIGVIRVGDGREYHCEKGYFVLGDNTRDSFDSRFEGELEPQHIQGRALMIIWPLHRFGFVTP